MERTVQASRFIPPSVDLDQVRQAAWAAHPLTDDLPLHLEIGRTKHLGDQEFEPELRKALEWMQKQNGTWAERQLDTIRETVGDWSVDGLLANKEGRLKVDEAGSYTWSSFRAYMSGNGLPFDIERLIKLRDQDGQWYFPLTARRDSILIWLADFDSQVTAILDNELKGDAKIEDFPIIPQGAPEMPSMLRSARIVRNKVGSGKFASGNVLLGNVGFWQRTERTPLDYIPRVEFPKSSLLLKSLYVSGLPEGLVVMTGGLTMDQSMT